ncbi:Mobile element protein [Candidatus Enterovibrio altilux]|uniref:Mobile element protein n=2 Tax=Candidatus Enterovibrio altilux TaxID=1927128 RepID=A0A291B7A1_9GAMM|nr:Mobile element protein [Candidatus Enterovibrio luxaltus]
MIKRVFTMLLTDLQKFINLVLKLAQLPVPCSHYSCISKRTKTVNITFKTKSKRSIST